jgi:hypothetical protein
LILTLLLQLALPPETPLPTDPMLAPRHMRPVKATPVPEYPAILSAPIFAPDRAPAATEGAGPEALTLAGLAVGKGVGVAIVRAQGAAPQSVRLGESVMGWRLTGVDPKHAAFERDGRKIILTYDPDNARAANRAPPGRQASGDEEADQ